MIEVPSDIRALIFDCDGTLADTMPLHLQAWQEMMAKFGGVITPREFWEFAGVPTKVIINTLNERHGTKVPLEIALIEKERLYFEIIHQVQPIAQVVDVAMLYRGKLPMAVASGGERYVVERTLLTIGIHDMFDAIVSADDVEHGKPSPDIFLESARRLKVEPEHCLVFEDADLGLQAASRANMRAIDVRKHL